MLSETTRRLEVLDALLVDDRRGMRGREARWDITRIPACNSWQMGKLSQPASIFKDIPPPCSAAILPF
jgi:hypothetical protein